MSSKKSPAAPAGRDAALQRLRKAEAAVAAALPLFSGKEKTPEQSEALQAALKELAAASQAVRELGPSADDEAFETGQADLARRFGKAG